METTTDFSLNTIYNEDCISGMSRIPESSVDCIICDPPYGQTNCEWDTPIPLTEMWKQYGRVLKENGAVLIFANEPFASRLRLSKPEWYKYDLYWQKERPTNFFQLKRRFGKTIENICVFYRKQPTYHPQMVEHIGKPVTNKTEKSHNSILSGKGGKITEYTDNGYRYPNELLRFNRENLRTLLHPTQKPVELIRYLLRAFTDKGEVVLDNCIGSGTTAVACLREGRRFIGFETDEEYYNISMKRIADETQLNR